MNRTILASVPTAQDDLCITDAAVPGLVAWLEFHLQQYTDAVLALGQPGGSRVAAPHYLR